jgi:hypothetical protein
MALLKDLPAIAQSGSSQIASQNPSLIHYTISTAAKSSYLDNFDNWALTAKIIIKSRRKFMSLTVILVVGNMNSPSGLFIAGLRTAGPSHLP